MVSALRETICVRFGRIASLSACVLFAGGCVIRIAYECFLDCNLPEVFCFQDGEQQFTLFLLDLYYCLLFTLCRGQLAPNVINLKRILNGKQNVWKYQNGEEKSDSDGREKDV